jgi:hypothetical protein
MTMGKAKGEGDGRLPDLEAGDVVLQSGLTTGRGSPTRRTGRSMRQSNVIYPTSYGAQHPDLEWQITSTSRRPDQLFHRHHQQVQQAVVLAEQYATAFRSRPLPAFHDDR